jgi:predicted hydrocarbon binding protein
VTDVAFEGAQSGPDSIKEMATQFPDIAPLVQAYGDSFNSKTRDRELFEAGKKIGAFNYDKEWSFGSPLKMPVALRRTLVPALEKFGKVEATDTDITLPDSPFYSSDKTSCCAFLTGFMQGFLDAGPFTKDTRVQEVTCRAKGALHCTYTVDYTV